MSEPSDLIERARALQPLIAREADEIERTRQAGWLGADVFVNEADGTRRRRRDGSPEVRTILFPVSSATLYDVWNVIGLKGTGTDSYSVDNLFISEEFAALRDEPSALRE